MKYLSLVVAICLFGVSGCLAQESRGSIIGRTTDASGAVVAGVKVQALNIATNTGASSISNSEGHYEIPYLLPGVYRITAELANFKKAVRDEIQVRVNDRLIIDFQLEIGDVSQSIVVKGETPLLQATDASVGMVMDQKRLTDLPIKGGNPLYLMRLLPGVTPPSRGNGQNPFDPQAGTVTLNVNGTRGSSNEVTLDGVTNLSQTNNTYSAPQDLVQEFKLHTASYDAALGHAAGAVLSISIKSGTNTPHGTAYYFDSRIQANLWFSNKWLYDPTTGPITAEKRRQANPGRLNQRLGFTLTGPIFIPHVYKGRNRTFFTFGIEPRVRESLPVTFTGTVPTSAERQGDFSGLLKLGSQYQIYDPSTIASAPNGRFSRQPLAGNLVPASRINPIATNLMKYWPMPNASGTVDGRQNFFMTTPSNRYYHSELGRIDHNFSDNHRLFVRFSTFGWHLTQNYNMPTLAYGDNTRFKGYGGVIDDVYVLNPQLLLDVRYGVNYEHVQLSRNSQGFDLASLGFSPSLINEIRSKDVAAGFAFPLVSVDGGAFTNMGNDGGYIRTTYYQTFASTVTKITGNHSIRMGAEFRLDRENGYNFGQVAPSLDFSTTWTRGPLDNSTGAPIGQGLASMLLGLPTGGRIDINASRAEQSTFMGLFVQDDWRITPRLTMNLGLRYEYEGPITERFNRSLRGFDFTTPSPIDQQVRTNYALAPIPQMPASAFRATGGLTFAGVNGQPRALWNSSRTNFAPRVGLVYQLLRKTVVRAGYGIFFDPQGVDRQAVNQTGFSQSTSLVPSLNNGLSFVGTLSNPFPNGLQMPVGAGAGLGTYLGRSISFFNENMPNPYMQRWSLSVQQELPQRVLLDVAYVGNRGTKLAASRQLDTTPRNYLSTSPVRDQATIDFLSAQVKNPFYGIQDFTGTSLGNVNVSRSSLLYPFPQFTGMTVNMPTGFSWYHSLQVSANKRFTAGLTFHSAWTWSKWMEATSYLNATDPTPEKVISSNDYPHRLVVNAIYELPFGKGKTMFGNARGGLHHLIGGWQLESTYEARSGNPLGFGNSIFYGDLHDIPLPTDQRTIQRWFNIDAGFDRDTRNQLSNNIRTLSTRFNNVRSAGLNYFDSALVKNFTIREGVKVQFRMDAYNTLNHVQFSNPNATPTSSAFGTVTSELSDGQRQLYFGLKLVF